MARFVLRLENRTSMVGRITAITPGDGAAWSNETYRLKVGQPITAGSSVLGAINLEPTATRSEWFLVVNFGTFPGESTVIVQFGMQQVMGVFKPIVGAVPPAPRLLVQATAFPPTDDRGDDLAAVVTIAQPATRSGDLGRDDRPGSGNVSTDALAGVTAPQPLLALWVVNTTTIPATVASVTGTAGVRERPTYLATVPYLCQGAFIAPDCGLANLVGATYELVSNQPFQLLVQVDVGDPSRPSATRRVVIRVGAFLRDGSWHFFHSALKDPAGLLNVAARELEVTVADWGMRYVVQIVHSWRVLAPKPAALSAEE